MYKNVMYKNIYNVIVFDNTLANKWYLNKWKSDSIFIDSKEKERIFKHSLKGLKIIKLSKINLSNLFFQL